MQVQEAKLTFVKIVKIIQITWIRMEDLLEAPLPPLWSTFLEEEPWLIMEITWVPGDTFLDGKEDN